MADYNRDSIEYIEWDAFASYLECWTGTFKADPTLMEISEVVCVCRGKAILPQIRNQIKSDYVHVYT